MQHGGPANCGHPTHIGVVTYDSKRSTYHLQGLRPLDPRSRLLQQLAYSNCWRHPHRQAPHQQEPIIHPLCSFCLGCLHALPPNVLLHAHDHVGVGDMRIRAQLVCIPQDTAQRLLSGARGAPRGAVRVGNTEPRVHAHSGVLHVHAGIVGGDDIDDREGKGRQERADAKQDVDFINFLRYLIRCVVRFLE